MWGVRGGYTVRLQGHYFYTEAVAARGSSMGWSVRLCRRQVQGPVGALAVIVSGTKAVIVSGTISVIAHTARGHEQGAMAMSALNSYMLICVYLYVNTQDYLLS